MIFVRIFYAKKRGKRRGSNLHAITWPDRWRAESWNLLDRVFVGTRRVIFENHVSRAVDKMRH